MSYKPFLIAPFKTGLEIDTEPWMLPADAFSTIENGHVHHGVIEKRQGFARLAQFPKTNTNLAISAITQADPTVVTVTSTADFADGDTIQINFVVGMTEVNGNQYLVANKTGTTFELQDLDGTDIDSNGFTAYTSGGQVSFYPGDRIMGIWNFIDSTNNKETLVFTQTNVARFNGTSNLLEPLADAASGFVEVLSGTDTDYVHAANWASASGTDATPLYRLYFCNNKAYSAGAPIKDGIHWAGSASLIRVQKCCS